MICRPPRTDKARWMAYAINILLVWLFQNLLELTPQELSGTKEMAKYTTFLYAEQWFRSSFFVDAAWLDLMMMRNLNEYER